MASAPAARHGWALGRPGPRLDASRMKEEYENMSIAIQRSNMDFVDRTIQSVRDSRDICVETVMHGIKMGGERSQMDVLGVLMDAADMAKTSERYLIRGSPYFRRIAPAAIEVFESAARTAETVRGDEFFSTAAKSLRQSASSLRQID